MQTVSIEGMSVLPASGCEILPHFIWEERLRGSIWPPIFLLWFGQKRELVKCPCPEIHSETPIAFQHLLVANVFFLLSIFSVKTFYSLLFLLDSPLMCLIQKCSCSCAEKFLTISGEHAIAQNSSLSNSSTYFMKLSPCREEHKEPLHYWRLNMYCKFTELSFIECNAPTGIDWE